MRDDSLLNLNKGWLNEVKSTADWKKYYFTMQLTAGVDLPEFIGKCKGYILCLCFHRYNFQFLCKRESLNNNKGQTFLPNQITFYI